MTEKIMSKISVEGYFNISEMLKEKKSVHFKEYKHKLYADGYEYDERKKLDELVRFYDATSKNQASEIFHKLYFIKKITLTLVLIFAILFTGFYFGKNINIKIFLLLTFVLPTIWMLVVAYKTLTYSSPSLLEKSWLYSFLSKKFSLNSEDSHVIKTYSMLLFSKIGLYYTVGTLISTAFIFWAYSVNFYSASTYGFSQISENSINNLSQSYWSALITKLFIALVFLKLIVLFLAKNRLNKSILENLQKRGELFFDVMSKNVEVTKNESKISFLQDRDKFNKKESLNAESFLSNYFVLYYNLDEDYQKKIDFDFSKDADLLGKTYKSFAFSIFDKEDEDERVLHQLSNLVMIFTAPESHADETFKKDIQKILNNHQVKQIWVLPLKKDGDRYVLSKKGDKKYSEWKKQINSTIKNPKVKLYNEK